MKPKKKTNDKVTGKDLEVVDPYLRHQEAQSGSLPAVVPAAYPVMPAGFAGTVKGERTESL